MGEATGEGGDEGELFLINHYKIYAYKKNIILFWLLSLLLNPFVIKVMYANFFFFG